MRSSGKTTRTIDKAIQKLFNEGEIWIPTKSRIKSISHPNTSQNKKDNYLKYAIVDPDWESGLSQNHLVKLIMTRLEFEHFNQVEIKHENEITIFKLKK